MTGTPGGPGQHRPGQPRPGRANARTIMVSCATCPGARGFTSLRVTRIGGDIVLDPHVAGFCVLVFDETAATALFDILGEWLG